MTGGLAAVAKPLTAMDTPEPSVATVHEAAPADDSRPAPSRTPPAPGLPDTLSESLDPPQRSIYLNRELTWINFAWRVAQEAMDRRNPLLERLKFIAIVGSTLDEFFMKRMGGLKTQVEAGVIERTVDGRTPHEQIRACQAMTRDLAAHVEVMLTAVLRELAEEGIELVPWEHLEEDARVELRDYYFENIFPLVTPQAMDPAHPFPFVSNLSLNLLVTLHYPEEDRDLLARVKVPVGAGIPRLLQVSGTTRFVRLEEVMAYNLDLLFPGMKVADWAPFRVTRNANTEGDEDQADDLLALIESEIRERKFADIVRLQVMPGLRTELRKILAAEFRLDDVEDVFVGGRMLGLAHLFELVALERPDLKYPPHRPVDHPALPTDRSIFRAIRDAGSVLVHHPYESFGTSVQRFLKEASTDPRVRAIKMTLYRTSEDTNIIGMLVDAARNGKQVAVVVELKARFDEAANIRWASRLEQAGIHVSYGVVGLKTHSKVILVVRQDRGRLRRYAHIGTGNYHAGNARGYTDVGVLTCDDEIGHDVTELFNFLTTGYRPDRHYHKLLVAPRRLKRALLQRIEREAEIARGGGEGLIQLKMNALEDADITRALYEASRAGAKIDLIVRDTCRLRPGIPGLSQTVTVRSIVGRFLEHARVYYFRAGGAHEYFIGSADLMQRNLESRVEVVAPVQEAELKAELREVLDMQLTDDRAAWVMQPDGSYERGGGEGDDCQVQMMAHADRKIVEAAAKRERAQLPHSQAGRHGAGH